MYILWFFFFFSFPVCRFFIVPVFQLLFCPSVSLFYFKVCLSFIVPVLMFQCVFLYCPNMSFLNFMRCFFPSYIFPVFFPLLFFSVPVCLSSVFQCVFPLLLQYVLLSHGSVSIVSFKVPVCPSFMFSMCIPLYSYLSVLVCPRFLFPYIFIAFFNVRTWHTDLKDDALH